MFLPCSAVWTIDLKIKIQNISQFMCETSVSLEGFDSSVKYSFDELNNKIK